jgi:hypothetical protein
MLAEKAILQAKSREKLYRLFVFSGNSTEN